MTFRGISSALANLGKPDFRAQFGLVLVNKKRSRMVKGGGGGQ